MLPILLAPFVTRGVAVVHSRKRESFGIAVVEAIAAGLPVVAARSNHPYSSKFFNLAPPLRPQVQFV